MDGKMHLGHSPLTDRVYLGKQRGNHWVGNKRDVTNEFLQVMVHKFQPNTVSDITVNGEVKYRILIVESGKKIEVDGKEI